MSHTYPVPLSERRPVPAWARSWGDDVDYPAPGLLTPDLQQNIHIDSIFVKSGELIIPDKCEECRLRAKGCDRARPLCGRCEKIGKQCIPVTDGWTRLRKGRGGGRLPGRVWGQSEDPEEVERRREERERLERETKEKEVREKAQRDAMTARQMQMAQQQQQMPPPGMVSPNRKRKRPMAPPVQVPTTPPSKGHYVDYASLAIFHLLPKPISAEPSPVQTPIDPNNIPIDPVLLEMSAYDWPTSQTPTSYTPNSYPQTPFSQTPTYSQTPTSSMPPFSHSSSFTQSSASSLPAVEGTIEHVAKRIKRSTSSNSPPPSTGTSTPASLDPDTRVQSSGASEGTRVDTPNAISKPKPLSSIKIDSDSATKEVAPAMIPSVQA